MHRCCTVKHAAKDFYLASAVKRKTFAGCFVLRGRLRYTKDIEKGLVLHFWGVVQESRWHTLQNIKLFLNLFSEFSKAFSFFSLI